MWKTHVFKNREYEVKNDNEEAMMCSNTLTRSSNFPFQVLSVTISHEYSGQ